MNVGIAGCGVIGSVLRDWLLNHTKHEVLVSDPAKGFNDDLYACDVCFISIHIPTEDDGTQDLSNLKSILKKLNKKSLVWLRTTVLPGTCDKLSDEFKMNINFLPEFLSERTAKSDFERQKMIFTGDVDVLKEVFPGKEFIVMSSEEAELAKYAHNVFGALKVTYFNCIAEICRLNSLSYDNVKAGVLASGYINNVHLDVPGHDGKFGFGGKCFPKDVRAFVNAVKDTSASQLLNNIESLNKHFRSKK